MKRKTHKFEVAAEIYRSFDYDMFELAGCNRPIHKDDGLEESMAKHGFMDSHPMQCVWLTDDVLGIVAGHHRFLKAKKLGLPVQFVIDDSNTDMYELEGSGKSTWSSYDFVYGKAAKGDPAAQAVLDFKEAHCISIGVAASLLGGGGYRSGGTLQRIKKGTFKLGNPAHANAVVAITDTLRLGGAKFASSGSFVTAVSLVLRVAAADYDRLMRQSQLYAGRLVKRSSTDECLQELENLYNYRCSRDSKVPLEFWAKQAEENAKHTQ